MCNTHIGKFFPHECAPIVFFHRGLIAKNLYGECLQVAIAQWGLITLGNYEMCVFLSVDDPRGLVAKGNYEVSVSQVSMPRGASSPRETMK